MNRQTEWLAIILVLLLAFALRFWTLGEVPPGLHHDEIHNWLIARDILSGHHSIYFTAAGGHEPLYQYVQAATVFLFGNHWLGLRYPSVAFGLLGLVTVYVLIRRLFGVSTALLTSSWLAVSFWPIFYSRVGLRAIMLFSTAALSAYFLLRAVNLSTSQSTNPLMNQSTSNWLLAALFLGLSFYTYVASRILPFILILFLIYLLIVRRPAPIPWTGLFAFLLTAAIMFAPLAIWLAIHPGVEYRVKEVREPLDRLLAGDSSLVWQNFVANLKFFTFSGDPWPQQNLPGRPVFADPASFALFYIGLLIALWRWHDPRYGFVLLWLVGALVPSIFTSVAPSSIRNILGLVVVFVFPAFPLAEAGYWFKRRMQDVEYKTRNLHFLIFAFCFLFITPCLFLSLHDYFGRWPQNEDVRYFYQADLTAVAHWLETLPAGTPITVAGRSVHLMDGPSLELAARRDVGDIRLCDTRQTLVIPEGQNTRLFVPQTARFDVDLLKRLLGWGTIVEVHHYFTAYYLADDTALQRDLRRLETMTTLPDGTVVVLPVSFGGRLAFVGYEQLEQALAPGDSLTLLTYWRVDAPSLEPLKIFVHLLRENETLIAQHDGLASPARRWADGDLIIQKHTITLPAGLPPGQYHLQIGVYYASDPKNRLPVLAADRLLLHSLEVPK